MQRDNYKFDCQSDLTGLVKKKLNLHGVAQSISVSTVESTSASGR